jgi:hypothetical protein
VRGCWFIMSGGIHDRCLSDGMEMHPI